MRPAPQLSRDRCALVLLGYPAELEMSFGELCLAGIVPLSVSVHYSVATEGIEAKPRGVPYLLVQAQPVHDPAGK